MCGFTLVSIPSAQQTTGESLAIFAGQGGPHGVQRLEMVLHTYQDPYWATKGAWDIPTETVVDPSVSGSTPARAHRQEGGASNDWR